MRGEQCVRLRVVVKEVRANFQCGGKDIQLALWHRLVGAQIVWSGENHGFTYVTHTVRSEISHGHQHADPLVERLGLVAVQCSKSVCLHLAPDRLVHVK